MYLYYILSKPIKKTQKTLKKQIFNLKNIKNKKKEIGFGGGISISLYVLINYFIIQRKHLQKLKAELGEIKNQSPEITNNNCNHQDSKNQDGKISILEQKVNILEQQFSTFGKEYIDLKGDYKKQIEYLREKNKKLNQNIDFIAEQISQLNCDNNNLENQISSIEILVQQLQTEDKMLMCIINQLNKDLKIHIEKQFHESSMECENKINSIFGIIEGLNESQIKIEEQNKRFNKKLEHLNKKRNILERDFITMKQDVEINFDLIKKTYTDVKKNIETLCKERESLNKEIESLNFSIKIKYKNSSEKKKHKKSPKKTKNHLRDKHSHQKSASKKKIFLPRCPNSKDSTDISQSPDNKNVANIPVNRKIIF